MKNTHLIWQHPGDERPYEGEYFVAIKNIDGSGSYDFCHWNGTRWNTNSHEEIVGWVPFEDLKSFIKAGWPSWPTASISNTNEMRQHHPSKSKLGHRRKNRYLNIGPHPGT